MNELLHVSKTPGPVGSKCPHAGQNRVRGILRGGESLRYPYRPVMPVDEDEIGKSPSYVTSDHQHRSPGLSEQRQPHVFFNVPATTGISTLSLHDALRG